ncbi:MAG: glycosyltransferase family 2 protein [Parcubacteria group bacterium]|nr:glycosyltransferase family 2 protein [Parcubacteria group bacterium]
MISVVFPTYNEEGNVRELHARLKKTLDGMGEPYEMIAVDAPSSDNTLAILKTLTPLKIVVFGHRTGPAPALNEGIRQAKGDVVVIIDADLQENPEDIPKLLSKLREGYDLVSGLRTRRKDTWGRRLISRFANRLTRALTGVPIRDLGSQFKVARREVFQDILLYGEMHAFIHVICHARGFKVTEVPIVYNERKSGKTKYSVFRVATLFLDLLVVKFFADYFMRPLMFFGGWGLACIFLGFVAAGTAIALKLMGLWTLTQTPLPLLASLLVVVGVLLFMMGFLAEILFRIYYEGRGKTPYIVREVITTSEDGK